MRLADRVASRVSDRDTSLDLGAAVRASGLIGLAGQSVLVAVDTQIEAAAAFVGLDGLASRLAIVPPDVKQQQLDAMIEDAEIDVALVGASDRRQQFGPLPSVAIDLADTADGTPSRECETEWVMLTSGTSGRPKLVGHSLGALTGAIADLPKNGKTIWSTFYDIRRYGGLQIFLRAVLGGADLVVTSQDEALGEHLCRLGSAAVTDISGTPSHWRRVLMSAERNSMAPSYIRLSGETADQMVLDGLRATYPDAVIGHAYASTEAGVGFAVDDGREGFPATLVDDPSDGLQMKIVDGSLRIRSDRVASRYLGAGPPPLLDDDGYVDTGDLVERRGNRFFFVGRRGGIINVGGLKVNPEEVEAAINRHPAVRVSLVHAKRNALTGAIVAADVVLRDGASGCDEIRGEIIDFCRANLERHKVPAILRFVASLKLTPAGKLSRANGDA